MTKGEKFVGVAPSSEVATVIVGEAVVGGSADDDADLALSCFKRSAALVTLEFVSLRPQWRWKENRNKILQGLPDNDMCLISQSFVSLNDGTFCTVLENI